jgi:hypothetical protein
MTVSGVGYTVTRGKAVAESGNYGLVWPLIRKLETSLQCSLFSVSVWEKDRTIAGRLACRVVREMDSLWTFLDHHGFEPINNRAERTLRFGVL